MTDCSIITTMPKFSLSIKSFVFVLILINVFLSAWYVINGDIVFHTDIARDFLVLQDIVETHKPTLIGPRSGGISGVFHGPAWFYLNLPAFVIGQGSPLVVGWFWVGLSIFSLVITYVFGKRLFDKQTALMATLILSTLLVKSTSALFNPFGAVILFPVFFYLFFRYQQTGRWAQLLWAWLALGFIIQFQIAFGVPILLLSLLYLFPKLCKQRKLKHLLTLIVLVIPLSTYILFELRHDFLQLRSIISYLTKKQDVGEIKYIELILGRIKGILVEGIQLVPENFWLGLPISAVFISLLTNIKKNINYSSRYWLFFYFYIGYWIITLGYKGVVWGYYYWPFLPVTALIFASSKKHLGRLLYVSLFLYILVLNIYSNLRFVQGAGNGWYHYQTMVDQIYRDAGREDFGYYVYSPDQFGYSEKYAFIYQQKFYQQTKSFPFQKKRLTYLTIAPAPSNRPWLDGNWWKKEQVKLGSKPIKKFRDSAQFVIEKYQLSSEEQKILSDPNLIQDLTFR